MKVPGYWVGCRTPNGSAALNFEQIAAVEEIPNGYALIYLNGGKVIETIEPIKSVLDLLGFEESK